MPSISDLTALPEAVRAMLASHSLAPRTTRREACGKAPANRSTNAVWSGCWGRLPGAAVASRPCRSGARQSDGALQPGMVVLELEFAAVQPRDGGGEA